MSSSNEQKMRIDCGKSSIDEEQLIKRKIIMVMHYHAETDDKYKMIIRSIYEKSHKLGIRWNVEKRECDDGDVYIFHKI